MSPLMPASERRRLLDQMNGNYRRLFSLIWEVTIIYIYSFIPTNSPVLMNKNVHTLATRDTKLAIITYYSTGATKQLSKLTILLPMQCHFILKDFICVCEEKNGMGICIRQFCSFRCASPKTRLWLYIQFPIRCII